MLIYGSCGSALAFGFMCGAYENLTAITPRIQVHLRPRDLPKHRRTTVLGMIDRQKNGVYRLFTFVTTDLKFERI